MGNNQLVDNSSHLRVANKHLFALGCMSCVLLAHRVIPDPLSSRTTTVSTTTSNHFGPLVVISPARRRERGCDSRDGVSVISPPYPWDSIQVFPTAVDGSDALGWRLPFERCIPPKSLREYSLDFTM